MDLHESGSRQLGLGKVKEGVTTDELDAKIIQVLAKDSRVSFRKIAAETGLSADTVMRRYKELEKKNVIQPVLSVDMAKLGYEAWVFYGIRVESQQNVRQITEKVAKIPDMSAVMETTGEYDLTVIAAVRSINHIFAVGDAIAEIEGIRRVSIDWITPFIPGWSSFPPAPWHNLHLEI